MSNTNINPIDALATFKAAIQVNNLSVEAKLALAALENALSMDMTLAASESVEITLKNTDATIDDLASEVEVAAALEVIESVSGLGEVASANVIADVPQLVTTDAIDDTASGPSDVSPAVPGVASSDAVVAVSEIGATNISADPPEVTSRRSTRLRLQEAAAADSNAVVSVTPSATGEGVHTRWLYSNVTTDAANTIVLSDAVEDTHSTSSDGATLVGSDDERRKTSPIKGEPVPTHASAPSPFPVPIPPLNHTPSKKRARDSSESEESDGPAKRTRSRVAFAIAPATPTPVGTRHRRRRAPTPGPRSTVFTRSRSPSPAASSSTLPTPTPTPSTPSSTLHPNPRPRTLARAPAFYHRSNYAVAWVPEFGSPEEQPVGLDAWPARRREKKEKVPESVINRTIVPEGKMGPWTAEKVLALERERARAGMRAEKVASAMEAVAETQTVDAASSSRLPSPPPTPAAPVSKRAREDDDEEGEGEGRRTRVRLE